MKLVFRIESRPVYDQSDHLPTIKSDNRYSKCVTCNTSYERTRPDKQKVLSEGGLMGVKRLEKSKK
ncbi:hypothetical protein BLOT_006297 [Blomia tropicalis]|nr:hypothetical protein BLOT_006297 [Blomia tropicalis]